RQGPHQAAQKSMKRISEFSVTSLKLSLVSSTVAIGILSANTLWGIQQGAAAPHSPGIRPARHAGPAGPAAGGTRSLDHAMARPDDGCMAELTTEARGIRS